MVAQVPPRHKQCESPTGTGPGMSRGQQSARDVIVSVSSLLASSADKPEHTAGDEPRAEIWGRPGAGGSLASRLVARVRQLPAAASLLVHPDEHAMHRDLTHDLTSYLGCAIKCLGCAIKCCVTVLELYCSESTSQLGVNASGSCRLGFGAQVGGRSQAVTGRRRPGPDPAAG